MQTFVWLAALASVTATPTLSTDFEIDPPVLMARPADSENHPAVAFDGTNFLVAWEDFRSGSFSTVVATRVTPSGEVLDHLGIELEWGGGASVVFDGTDYVVFFNDYAGAIKAAKIGTDGSIVRAVTTVIAGTQKGGARVAFNGTQFFVVWTDARNGASNLDIYGARVGLDLTVQSTFPVDRSANNQLDPEVAWDGTRFLVVWTDHRGSTTAANIYGRRFGAESGADAASTAICTATGHQEKPTLAVAGTTFLIAWADRRVPPNGSLATSHIYAASGSTTAETFSITELPLITATGFSAAPALGFDGTNFLLAYTRRATSADQPRLFGTRISAAGSVIDGVGVQLTSSAMDADDHSHIDPRIAAGAGGFLIPWLRYNQNWLKTDLFGTRVQTEPALSPVGDPFPIATKYNAQTQPAAASNGSHTLAVWRDDRIATSFTTQSRAIIRGALLGADGRPLSPSSFAVGLPDGAESRPDVAVGADRFLVAWSRGNAGTGLDIHGAFVGFDGTVSAPFVIEGVAGDQSQPTVAFDGTNFFVAWRDARTASDVDIYGLHLTPDGARVEAEAIQLSAVTGTQSDPAAASAGDGTVLVIWSGPGIAGTRVGSGGEVLDSPPVALDGSGTRPDLTFAQTQYLAVWMVGRQVEGQLIGADGALRGGQISVAGSLSDLPVVTTTGVDFLVGHRTGTATELRRVDANGAVLDTAAVNVASPVDTQDRSEVTGLGPESAVALYADARTSFHLRGKAISLTPVPHAPVATAQSVSLDEDGFRDLVLEAFDADGDEVTFRVLTEPAHGALTGDGAEWRYTPEPDFHGPDSFTFEASDGALTSAPASITLTVTPVNDPPVAQDLAVTTEQDTAAVVPLTATDVDGDSLTFVIEAAPAQGTLSGAVPHLIYTPASGFVGSDSFQFTARDGHSASSVRTVEVEVLPAAPATDAGIADAGPGETDAGAPGDVDAGPGDSADAGTSTADAGTRPSDGGSGGPGGSDEPAGCGCSGGASGTFAWAALWVAAAWRRRRRTASGR